MGLLQNLLGPIWFCLPEAFRFVCRLTSLVHVWVGLMLKHLSVGMISGSAKEREGLKVS